VKSRVDQSTKVNKRLMVGLSTLHVWLKNLP